MAVSDWASAANTGVRAGVTLKAATQANVPDGVTVSSNGDVTVTKSGVVLSGLDIKGSVYINADNVTLIDCKVTAGGPGVWYVVKVGSGVTGAVVQNCTIDGLGTGPEGGKGIAGSGTFIANNISGVEDGILAYSGTLIQDNYIHDLKANGAPHYDGIQLDGGVSNVIIRHNTVINTHGQTSAVMIDNYFGPISNVTVDNNLLVGGGYTIYVDGQFSGGPVTNVSITNNHMGKGQYGITNFNKTSPIYTGNVNDGASLAASLPTTGQPPAASQPPSAPTIASFSNDSGTQGDGVTNDSTLTVTGTAAAGSTVKVLDNGAQIGTATANSSGAWSYTTGTLSNGNHSLTATTTTSAGTSAASSALAVKIDTVAPAAPTIGTPATGANGNVSLSGTAEANSTVTLYDGGTQIGTVTANGSGAWSFTATNLAQTSHSFTARATDAAGNASTASAAKVVDTTSAPAPTPPSTPAPLSDWPDASNTGLPDGVTLTASGDVYVTTAGAVINALDVKGTIWVMAANVTIQNCKITSTDWVSIWIKPGITGTTVKDCEISNVGSSPDGANGIVGAGTFLRNDIHDVENGFNISGPSTIQDNYVHDMNAPNVRAGTQWGGPHYDGIEINGGVSNVTIKHNTIINENGQTSAVMINNYFGPISNVTVDNNLLVGGGYTLYSDGQFDGGPITGVVFTNNVVGEGHWGYSYFVNNTPVWQGNRDLETGQTVTASNSIGMDGPQITSYSVDSGIAGDGITSDKVLELKGTAAVFATVNVYDGTTLIGTATADATNKWSLTTPTLADGNHSITVIETSGSVASQPSSPLVIRVDTVAPAAPTIGTPTTGANGNVSLSGTAEANSTVTLYDGGPQIGTVTANGSGAWSFTATNLAQTSHSFTARATDAAGNASTASAAKVVDTTPAPAPTPPSAPTIASFSNDSGAKGDGVTNDSTLTLTGTAAAGSTVKVLDNGAQIGTATANSSGAWSYTTGTLSNGSHSLTATATTSAGTSAASSALAVKIDTVAPAAPTIGTPTTGANGNVSLSGTAEANSTVTLYDGGPQIGTVTANGSGAWSFTATNLAQTSHSFTARATDAAGNASTASAAKVVDTTPAPAPTPPSAPTIASFSNDSGAKGDGVTNDSTLTLTGTAAAGSTVKVLDNGAQIGTATANSSGAWSYTTGTLSNGSHSLTATATTSAGTSAASSALAVKIDTVAPAAPTIGTPTTGANGNVSLSGTAEADSTVTLYDAGTPIGTVTANGSGAWSFTATKLAQGNHSFTARATDVAGNTSAFAAPAAIKVDTLAPVKPKIWSYSQDTGVVGDGLTNATSVKLTGAAEAHARVKVYNGDDLIGETVASNKGAWSFTAGTLEHGATYDFKVTATDVAQNTSVASDTLSMTIDKVAPSMPQILSYSPGNQVLGITKSNVITLEGTAEANSTIKLYSGSKYIGTTLADGNGDWSLTTAPLPNATHRFAATATDAAGNTSPLATLVSNGGTARSSAIEDHAVMLVTVDTKAPKQPAVTSFSTDTGKIGDRITSDDTLVLRGLAEAGSTIDVYAGDTLLGSTIADANGAWSFLTDDLQDGAYTFTFKATDLAGNTSAGSRPLHVTVDTHVDAPVILSPGPTGSYSKTSALTIKGNAEAFSAISLYAGETLLGTAKANAQGDWSFRTSKLPDGEYSFSAIATDLAGNESLTSNIATATVDTTTPIRPVITALTANDDVAAGTTINSNAITLTGTAEAGSLVTVTDGKTVVGTATADGAGLWSLTAASLTEGAHRFTVRSTDADGNQSAVSTAVGIRVDTLAPGQPNHFAATATDAAGNTSPPVSEAGSTVDVYAADVARSGVTLHHGSFDAVFNHALAGDNRDLALLQEFVVSPTMPPDARWWPDEPHHNGFLFLF